MTQALSTSIPPWSTATLEAFTTCPYRYYRTQVKKDVDLPENPATTISRQLHEAFYSALAEDVPLPNRFKRFESHINHLKNLPGEKRVHYALGVDREFKPCHYNEAWARATVDFIVSKDNQAVLVSWRTGNYEPSDQLRLCAALYFAVNPECEILHLRTFWLRNNKVEKESYTRKNIPELWKLFVPAYTKWRKAFETDTWHQTPGGLCSKYCGMKDCKYCLG